MAVPNLKIAGIEFALQTFPVSQSYRRIEGGQVQRMQNGAGIKQQHWHKLATTISGDGWAPAAMAAVDWSASVEILCMQPRAIHSATAAATLPSAHRTDGTVPYLCYAVVGGELIATPVAVVGNAATATPVTGATSYQFYYYPKITCYSAGPIENLDMSGAVYGWTIEAEEV